MHSGKAVCRLALVAVLAGLDCTQLAQANPIALPAGVTVDPPDGVDVTYQVVPTYDEQEKVIAGWTGQKLQYFVSLERLPPGYLDAKSYINSLAREIAGVWNGLDIGRQATYHAEGGLNVTVVEFRSKADSGKAVRRQIIHFLTDSKRSFVAIASLVPTAGTEEVFDQTAALLRTASVDPTVEPRPPAHGNESPFFGRWVAEERGPGNERLAASLELKERPDLLHAGSAEFHCHLLRGGSLEQRRGQTPLEPHVQRPRSSHGQT